MAFNCIVPPAVCPADHARPDIENSPLPAFELLAIIQFGSWLFFALLPSFSGSSRFPHSEFKFPLHFGPAKKNKELVVFFFSLPTEIGFTQSGVYRQKILT
jgi:hypothetical protein